MSQSAASGRASRVSERMTLIATSVLVAAVLAAAPALGSSSADFPSLVVVFHTGGTTTVTLPDGTPVGTTAGSPTVISPGIYNVLIDDSAFVSDIEFDLAGPGVKLVTSASSGESPSETWVETFLPSTAYTWRDDNRPQRGSFNFVTAATASATSTGPASPVSTVPISSGKNGQASSTDIVGSQSAKDPLRGTLTGVVSAAAKLTLTSKGKSVANLKSGRYTFDVSDRSRKGGFTVQEIRKSAITVTGISFVGRHKVTIDLKPGQWFYFPTFVGKKTYFIVER
jgi:hypothetical protein